VTALDGLIRGFCVYDTFRYRFFPFIVIIPLVLVPSSVMCAFVLGFVLLLLALLRFPEVAAQPSTSRLVLLSNFSNASSFTYTTAPSTLSSDMDRLHVTSISVTLTLLMSPATAFVSASSLLIVRRNDSARSATSWMSSSDRVGSSMKLVFQFTLPDYFRLVFRDFLAQVVFQHLDITTLNATGVRFTSLSASAIDVSWGFANYTLLKQNSNFNDCMAYCVSGTTGQMMYITSSQVQTDIARMISFRGMGNGCLHGSGERRFVVLLDNDDRVHSGALYGLESFRGVDLGRTVPSGLLRQLLR